MKVHLNAERTSTGIRVAVTGDQIEPFTITTQYVSPPNIGKYVVDMILDTIYVRNATIDINGTIAFEAFDVERDYEDFIRIVEAV